MIGSRIMTAIRNRKHALAARLPAPMAAPETVRLRQMRITLVAHLALLVLITLAWGPIATSRIVAIAALAWIAVAIGALVIGTRWLVLKVRADNAWVSREREE